MKPLLKLGPLRFEQSLFAVGDASEMEMRLQAFTCPTRGVRGFNLLTGIVGGEVYGSLVMN